jgi:putative nucleotidyltransferase with HDIG domain
MNLVSLGRLADVNKELWLILSLFVLAAALNFLIASHQIVLGCYTLPTLFAAYYYGRRHAILTALASLLLVVLVVHFNPTSLVDSSGLSLPQEKWYHIAVWGCTLVVIAYAMGKLFDHKEAHLRELKETYNGVLLILQQFISKDKYTQNHSYRVSIYASLIASYLGFNSEQIEDVRAAALLHDIGKLDISRDILYKAARLTRDEFEAMKGHVEQGVRMLGPVGGTLRRVLPIVVAHHDKFDGSGYHATRGEEIPLEARVIAVADVYDSLTSDRPYRKAMSPFDAKEIIVKGSGTDFDPQVVEAFLSAFCKGNLEVPEVMI